jgi:DNA-binding LacI/PurR family transcriptional regulator
MAGPKPKYVEIAQRIQRRIVRGIYQSQLPGARKLAAAFGVNPKTTARALDYLVAQGVLYRPNSRRTYVREKGTGGRTPSRPETKVVRLVNSYQSFNTGPSPFSSSFLEGAQKACRQHKADVRLDVSETPLEQLPDPKYTARYLDTLERGDHVVLLGCEVDKQTPDMIRSRGLNVVLADPRRFVDACHMICFDWYDGMRHLVDTIRMCGHRRMAAVLRDPGASIVASRILNGLRDGMEQTGLSAEDCRTLLLDEPEVADHDAMVGLLRNEPRPTMVISNTAEWRVISRAAETLGMRIPTDLSVVMLGESRVTMSPTTVARLTGDGEMMGQLAVNTLLEYEQINATVTVHIRMDLHKGETLRRPRVGQPVSGAGLGSHNNTPTRL